MLYTYLGRATNLSTTTDCLSFYSVNLLGPLFRLEYVVGLTAGGPCCPTATSSVTGFSKFVNGHRNPETVENRWA